MDTGAVAGKSEAVCGDEPVFQGGNERSKAEEQLKPLFIVEGKLIMRQCVSGDGFRDAGMFIRKLFSFTGFLGRFFVFVRREEILPAGSLEGLWLWPEPVHEVEVGAKRRQGSWGAANEGSKKAVSPELLEPGSKAVKAEHQHEDKGADDLGLVFSWSSGVGIEDGKEFHDGIQI